MHCSPRTGDVHFGATTVQTLPTLLAQPSGLDVPLGDPLQTCLSSPLSMAQGGAQGTSLGCSTLASPPTSDRASFSGRSSAIWPE